MLMKMSEYVFGGGDEDRVTEWEVGLPGVDDLTPLSQLLIPAELASAFSISPEPYRTAVEVNRASQTTFSTIRGVNHTTAKGSLFETTDPDPDPDQDPMVLEADENEITDRDGSGSDLKRSRNKDDECCVEIEVEEADSALRNNENDDDESAAAADEARTVKRPRLVWTPQLHKRFVDVVGHLGIKNAVPKTIMQLMNVEGLTRENVASHLQKYRLYLKRQQGGSGGGGGGGGGLFSDGPSSTSTSTSDHLFASTTPHLPNYHMPTMMPQMLGHMGMPPMGGGGHHHHHHPYNMFQQQQQQPMNSNYQYGSHPVAPNEN
ncbi:transcription factor PCL1-like [Castanea sativa]|uniref:transcription factor PCL1-like n=1 Tax=Castanea sativa TaxID=21020 RepID=UPI003F651BC1